MIRLGLALLLVSWATQLTIVNTPCPLDGAQVRVYEKVTANRAGGWDSDLASYSTEGQWRQYAVSTCPEDLFSLYGEDVDGPYTEAQVKAMKAALPTVLATLPAPEELEVWDRYTIAAAMYKALGRDARTMAQLYLEASWTARDAAVDVYKGLDGPQAARTLLDAGALELKKSLDAPTRKILLHNLARVAHRGGWSFERDRYLSDFEKVGGLTPQEDKVIRRFRYVTTQVEPRFQDLAWHQLKAWLATKPTGADKAWATYIKADIDRRRGRFDAARTGYQELLSIPEAEPQIKELARWFLAADANLQGR